MRSFVLLTTSIVFALITLMPDHLASAEKKLDSCKSDRARLCPGLARHECKLGRYVDQLSTMCRAVIEPGMKAKGKVPKQREAKGDGACAADRARLCGSSKGGADCRLGKMINELSPRCRATVQQRQATR
jgi:hypothetical protein